MNRRQLLKLGAAVTVSPSLPVKAAEPELWLHMVGTPAGFETCYSNRMNDPPIPITRESLEKLIVKITASYWRAGEP